MSVIQKDLFLVKQTKDFCVSTTEVVEKWEIIINPVDIREGAIKEIGAKPYLLLLAISSFMNEEGKCCPTQQQLADIIGWTVKTVRETLKVLLATEYKGKKLIERELIGEVKKHSKYTMVKEEEEVTEKKKTAKDFIGLFCYLYEEKYSVKYSPNWSRDTAIVKNKLCNIFADKLITKVFNYIFENYDEKWSNKKYPRPTIGAVTTWLFNTAVTEIQKLEQVENRIQEEIKADTTNYDNIFDKFI